MNSGGCAARHPNASGGKDCEVGTVHAVSAETGQTVWKYEQRAATMSLAVTGAGLVFGGDVNGCFLELTPELHPLRLNHAPYLLGHQILP